MKRSLVFVLVGLLMLLPTAPTFAQGPMMPPPGCDPETVLDDLIFRISIVQDGEDFVEFLAFAGGKLLECGGSWLNLLLGEVFGQFMGPGMMMPMPLNPLDDAPTGAGVPSDVLSADAVRDGIRAAFAGDLAPINAITCPAEQLDESELDSLPTGLEIVALECERLGDEMTCAYTITAAGAETSDKVTFLIVDELICGEAE